nr:hypothetical protein [Tanacetum cinerariifolium]
MEAIHVKFDEFTAMASEHDSLEPVSQRLIHNDSSAESMNTLTKEDLDNLFGPMYEEYFEKKSSEISINSAAQQANEFYQEDSAKLDGNTLLTPYVALDFSEVESSTNIDPSNMHELHQEEGIDFEESSARVTRLEAVRMFIAFIAHKTS